jgi:hypothetical protein
MPKDPVRLMQYEIESLEWVAANFAVDNEVIQGFGSSLNALSVLYLAVVTGAVEYREGRVVMLGLLNHAHYLLAGGLTALQTGNGIVWSYCLRGLIEVYGATVLIQEKPGKVVNHLSELSAGKLYAAAHRAKPELKADLERLHAVVHPGSRSMYVGFEPIDPNSHEVRLEFGLRPVKKEDGKEAVIVLGNMAGLLEQSLGTIASDPQVLGAGKVIMRANGSSGGSPFR